MRLAEPETCSYCSVISFSVLSFHVWFHLVDSANSVLGGSVFSAYVALSSAGTHGE